MENEVTQRELTYGEKAVGLTFNPSNLGEVDSCKQHYAKIIDGLHELRHNTMSNEKREISPEKARYIAIAITQAQDAQMWAVKAITWKE